MLRTPVIAGLTGDAGTSTLAAALHARDAGRVDGGADVLVCRASALHHAEALACPTWPRPVLAVTGDAAVIPPDPARLRALQARFGAVVLLPHLDRWDRRAAPISEASAVLAQPDAHLARPLRDYGNALRQLVAAVMGSGQLGRAAPPTVLRPRTVALWRGLGPVERGGPVQRRAAQRPPLIPEPDDDALEAEALPTHAASGRAA